MARDIPPESRGKLWAIVSASTDEEAARLVAVEKGESFAPSETDLDRLKAMRERIGAKK